MSLNANYPAMRPTLLLNFARAKQLDPRITFTRTTTATYFDSSGILRTAAAGQARFDHNPTTFESLGLLIEEQRTNLLLRSDDFANASWIRFGTTTLTANTSVAPDGTTTGDNIAFTSAFAGIYQFILSAASTTYTFSVWIKSSASTQIRLVINTNLSDPTIQTVTVSTGWNRFSIIKTTAVGTTSVTAQLQDTGSGNTQFDLWGAQLEVGAFATSYIPTVAASVTRNADAANMTGTNFSSWYNDTEGTLLADARRTATFTGSAFPRIAIFDDGTTANTNGLFVSTAASRIFGESNVNNVIQCQVGPSGLTLTNKNIAVYAYKVNDFAASVNGSAISTDTSGTLPVVTTFRVGASVASGYYNGTIAKVAYYPVRLSNEQLQALTS